MPQGVLHQGAADLENPLLVPEGRDLAIAGELERVLAVAGHGLELLEQQHGDSAEIDGRPLEMQVAGVEPGEIEELLGQFRQALDLLAHADEKLASRRLVELLVGEKLQVSPQGEERRAQLVRRVGDELAPGTLQLGQTLAHAVERAGQLAELVLARVDDRLVETPARDPVGGALEPADATGEDRRSRVPDQ